MDPPALVALRDRREAVIQILADGFANDLLELEAFENRTSLAHQATSVAELDRLVADLTLPSGTLSTALVKLAPDPALEAQRPQKKRRWIVFGSVERHGGWIVPRELETRCVFANAELDFREARFAPGVTTLRVSSVFSAVEIIVPPQLAVECDGHAVFGSFEGYGGAVEDPERPILRIEGTAVFGTVEISVRLPGESARQARKRGQLSEASRPALPPAK